MAALALLLATTIAALQAGGAMLVPKVDHAAAGEYRRGGAGFACVVTAANGDEAARKAKNGCLHYGPLAIGLPRTQAEAVLGRPAQTVANNGVEVFAYPLRSKPGSAGLSTYAALEFDGSGQIKMVQVSGDPLVASDWAFSSVRLGDDASVVERMLGRPLQVSPVPETGAELWAYQPWTFTLEIKGRKVVSIRLEAES